MIKLTISEPRFLKALPVIRQIEDQGFEAYFVGGSVRDTLLNKDIHDVDIATSAYPEEIKKIFRKTIDVGIDHGTVMVLFEEEEYEITTFRTESTYQDFRRPDSVTFVRSLKEDLKRRDFTINALAMDKDGVVVDYFEGITDLKEKRIKAVGIAQERFHEDALRMMRAVRFVSKLEFEMESLTKEAILHNNFLLQKIAVERIQIEFVQLLLGPGRQQGLLDFIETGLFQYCPHLEGTECALRKLAALTGPIVSSDHAWVLLVYVLRMPIEKVGSFLRAWKCSNNEIQTVKATYRGIKQKEEKGFLSALDLYELGYAHTLLAEEVYSLLTKEPYDEETEKRYKALPIHTLKDLQITGTDLVKHFGMKPGKWIGILLEAMRTDVLQGTLPNTREQLLQYAEKQIPKESKDR